MGRSRAVHQSADDDPTQRSKRKRAAPNVESFDTVTTDISGRIWIKCVVCADIDLCVECFSVGAEVQPHKSNHLYRVMDNLSFPLICADWNADEEMLLLEGMEMYGLANWAEVAEHVGTKSKLQCIDHYKSIYINSPCFPLPDMSQVMGKSREELLAMAKEQGYAAPGGVNVKEESLFSARVKLEDQWEENSAGLASGGESASGTLAGAGKRKSGILHSKENHASIKVEGCPADRSVGEKKPRTSVDEGPSMTELSGYNSKREEFEIEYDNDAEQMLADMEFKETDSNAERELKLRVLCIYSKRLDERKRRKDFILERKLLHPDPFEKDLTPEDKEICRCYRVFMRFSSKEEHEDFLRSIIEEHRMVKQIQDLQDARAAGCRTSAEAERYIEQKRARESEENVRRLKENSQSGPSGKYLQRVGHFKVEHDSSPREVARGPEITAPTGVGSALDIWDVSGFLGAELLSEAEKKLCDETRILATHYLNMLQTMSMGVLSGNITKKSDAHGLFNVDPNKVDKVYEMLVKKGLVQA
ncbi:unnamed protein product [Withania somnifera]